MHPFPNRVGRHFSCESRLAIAWLLLSALLFLSTAAPTYALQGQLNINTATAKELQQLPFIGETKAQAIINLRRKGRLQSLSELQKSPAIGPSTYQAILPYLKLSGASTWQNTSQTEGGQTPDLTSGNSTLQARSLIVTQPGEIQFLADTEYYQTVIHLIRTARKRIDIAMFIFKTSKAKSNRPRHIMQELTAARKRGVRIQVLLEKSGYDEELNK
ncbi:MAG: helix-hairpin-helix domain-containing protein, partial [Desulfobulbaceae bacterium]|nr:helix-hairpin-helix domain-containing protein [Desulfobulbaceae bacterium]